MEAHDKSHDAKVDYTTHDAEVGHMNREAGLHTHHGVDGIVHVHDMKHDVCTVYYVAHGNHHAEEVHDTNLHDEEDEVLAVDLCILPHFRNI